jgi:hypothetical protein
MLFLVLGALLYLAVSVVLLAAARPDYSHVRDTISQLGESGAPRARRMSYGVFLPVGLALAFVSYALLSRSFDVALLAAGMAVGYLGAWLFPCDAGSPPWGTWRQVVHNCCGGVQYVVGGFALYRIRAQNGPLSWAPAAVIFCALVTPFALRRFGMLGLSQRVAELTLFISLALAIGRMQ